MKKRTRKHPRPNSRKRRRRRTIREAEAFATFVRHLYFLDQVYFGWGTIRVDWNA